eukprot:6968142-Alexandrium_andersonii.AAC.1
MRYLLRLLRVKCFATPVAVHQSVSAWLAWLLTAPADASGSLASSWSQFGFLGQPVQWSGTLRLPAG